MAKTNNNAKNAGKTTAWDKVKDFINTGREYQVKAIEDTATYYADRINSKKQNNFLVSEANAPKPTTLGNMSYSGDPKLNAYLQKINANADKAVNDPRPAEKPAILDGAKKLVNTAADKTKDFINTGREYQVQAIEDTADYYAEKAMNKPTPKPVPLGSMSPTGDPELDTYLQSINANADRAGDNSRIDVNLSNDGTGKWLKAGAFEDGWQFGDGIKSYVATLADEWRQTKAGVYGLGEKAADTVLMVSPQLYSGLEPGEERSIYPVYSFNPEKRERDKELYAEWVSEDLYDEADMAKNLYADRLMEKFGIDVERDSLLGEKAKDFSYRAGQEAAVYALGVAGIPTWMTRGINAFASEAEHALRSGADYEEALTSALIHAGAETAATVLSGKVGKIKNMKIKDKTIGKHLDEFIDKKLLKNVSEGMSKDFLKSMIKFGIDFSIEGVEAVFIWGIGKYAESITYRNDKPFRELIGSQEAKIERIEEFLQGYLFSFSENVKAE